MSPPASRVTDERRPSETFVVKVRDPGTRGWGDQTEVVAISAKAAAEAVTGENLVGGPGERVNLRARAWALPFGSQPDLPFYVRPSPVGGDPSEPV